MVLVTKAYKLVHFYYDVNEWELYDRKKDPRELNNVYSDSAYADVTTELKKKLQHLRVLYKDSDTLNQYYIELHKRRAAGLSGN